MWSLVGALFVALLGYALVGLGPTLLLLRGPRRLENSLALAPALGFLLGSLLVSYLVLANVPVGRWAPGGFWGAAALSAVLTLVILWRRPELLRQADRRWLALLLGGLGVTFLVVMAPLAVGGLRFAAYRGNPADSLNYLDMAVYLDRVPLAEGAAATPQELLDRHPSLLMGRMRMFGRWVTSAMLAVTAEAVGTPFYRAEFGYCALMFVLAFGPALLLAEWLPLRRWAALAAALAVCTGFWAQFVVDLCAVSQCNSVPVLLTLGCLTVLFADSERGWGLYALLAACFAALLVLYTEAAPLALGGLGLFWLRSLCWRTLPWRALAAAPLAVALGLLIALPAFDVVKYLELQLHTALDPSTGQMHTLFFPWLFHRFRIEVWGFRFFSLGSASLAWLKHLGAPTLFATLSAVLWLALAIMGLRFVIQRRLSAAATLCFALVLAAAGQAAVLAQRHQLWAAGKAVSYAYPFGTLCVVCAGLAAEARRRFALGLGVVRAGVVVWLAVQLGAGLYRIGHTGPGDCPQYWCNFAPTYRDPVIRTFDWDLDRLQAALAARPEATVAVDAGSFWLDDFVALALPDQHVVKLAGALDHNTCQLLGRQTLHGLPDYLIVPRATAQQRGLERLAVGGNESLEVVRVEDGPEVRAYLKERGWER
jgi:hypothetical protein